MYLRDAKRYKKQQRRAIRKRNHRKILIVPALLFSVCICIYMLHVTAGEALPENRGEKKEECVNDITEISSQSFERYEEKGKETEAAEKITNFFQEETEENKKKYLIAVDPGHGGEDEGCSAEGVEEKALNLKIAMLLQNRLETMGFRVMLTRETDAKLSLEDRTELANNSGADAYIGIHQNACEDDSAKGMETWYCDTNDGSKRLAKLVQQYAVLYTKARDRGIQASEELFVLRESKMPSCLIETGFLTNQEERFCLEEDAYLDKLAQGIADGIQLYFYPKVMYLTFDDGPSEVRTNAILDVLKEKDVRATFFVVGKNVEKHPETAKRIVEEGHTIGIHCYDHAYDTLYAGKESFIEDFNKACKAVYDATGVKVWCFRFPGGSINNYNKNVYQDIINEMEKQGYVYYDWNASLGDAAANPEPEKLIQNAKESTLQRKKVVMLAHDIVGATVDCLDELIEAFPEYEMRALTKEVEPIQFK